MLRGNEAAVVQGIKDKIVVKASPFQKSGGDGGQCLSVCLTG